MAVSDADVLARYPQLGGFLNHPEIGPVLRDAAANGWGAQELQGAIFKTDWYKTTWADFRQLELLKSTDPAEYAKVQQEAQFSISTLLRDLGVDGNRQPDLVRILSNDWLRHGRDDWYLYQRIGDVLERKPELMSERGSIAAKKAEYRKLAADYMLDYGEGTLTKLAVNEWMNRDKRETIENRFRQEAIKRYAHLEDMLTRGLSVRQAMQPQTTAVARVLEMNPEAIDLTQPRWRVLMEMKDPNDGKLRAMTTSEADRWARNQEEFKYTKNARDEVYDVSMQILQAMGSLG